MTIAERQEVPRAAVVRRSGKTSNCSFLPLRPFQLLADARMRTGRPQKALEAVDRAISLYPGWAPPAEMLQTHEAALQAITK